MARPVVKPPPVSIPVTYGSIFHVRPPRTGDAESISRHSSDREIGRWTFIPYPNTVEQTREFLKTAARARRNNTQLHFAIVHNETGDVIGVIGLNTIDHPNKFAEIGFWLSRQFRRRGIMSEALMLVLEFCFRELGLKRIYAHVMVGNGPSALLLERMGFTLEGRLRRQIRRGKQWRDLLVYGMLREEFKPVVRKTTAGRPCATHCKSPCCLCDPSTRKNQ